MQPQVPRCPGLYLRVRKGRVPAVAPPLCDAAAAALHRSAVRLLPYGLSPVRAQCGTKLRLALALSAQKGREPHDRLSFLSLTPGGQYGSGHGGQPSGLRTPAASAPAAERGDGQRLPGLGEHLQRMRDLHGRGLGRAGAPRAARGGGDGQRHRRRALHDPEETGSRLSLGSELNSHSLVTVIGGEEEHFEDFGESHDLDLLLESPGAPLGEGSPAGQLHCSSLLLSPRADPFPASFQSFLREEALDFFCSQCHKQISRLEDLSTRLNFLEMNSSSKRLSSKKVARHLLQSSTLTIDSMDDLSRDMLDLADTDITDKVMFLEKRVSELETDSASNGEQHARLRQENLQLVRRHKEALCKLERERGLELENLQSRLQQLDEENSELRSCVPCLRANIERLEEEKRKLQDSVEDVTERLNEELESRRKMTDKLTHERHKNQKEKECTQELIEDLRRQLEHLQLYKLEVEAKSGRSPSAGLQEYQNRTREAELEQEVRRLKQDNRSLKEQNDELNGQIINLSIQGAKNLFATSFSDSLAAEISSVSRDELMEAIHKQEEINYRLQDYIDRIIVAIMESNPSILEVK
ncbi:hypothetical protein ANANG_G00039680 [Anguilla anguilla]|uniref:FIP-RBD domain-containing protein n=1 Tax=Anguilla anguilla TaxID=7936 RepID=A0A9D3MUY9_ANGAN|nr:hypothetical protein ANANG_G00039680 [Anguilla anguilla]